MNKKIVFVTGNKRKFNNTRKNLEKNGIEIIQKELDTIEIQSDNAAEVAKFSAIHAGNTLKEPLIKVDVGFHIEALKGFPGPYIKQINKWLEPEQILEMLANIKNRKCYFEDVVACYIPGKEVVTFSDKTTGTISKEVRGENGWGIDKIFIPDGFTNTLAEFDEERQIIVWQTSRWQKLCEYIKNNI